MTHPLIRKSALAALAVVAILGIMAVPDDTLPSADWHLCLILSKTIGLGAAIACRLLANNENLHHTPRKSREHTRLCMGAHNLHS